MVSMSPPRYSIFHASLGEGLLRAKAAAELAALTVDLDRANIMFSPADDGEGRDFAHVVLWSAQATTGQPARCTAVKSAGTKV
jgi:hypothetical protein